MKDYAEPSIGKYTRNSLRLKGFDYSLAGAYFATICTQGKDCLLGEVAGGEVILNEAGRMVDTTLLHLSQRFGTLEIDCRIVMPNHLHAILVLANSTSEESAANPQLGMIVGAFKSITTHEYTLGVSLHHWKPFRGKLWQRNYYERIIRNERELNAIREYIHFNPANWCQDENHP